VVARDGDVENLLEQCALRAELGVDGLDADPSFVSNLRERGAGVPLLQEQAMGRVDHGSTGFTSGGFPS
jgi:hypothetical protein